MSPAELAEWASGWPVGAALRRSALLYLVVNAAHILAIGLLIGAIVPLDLRLLGLVGHAPVDVLGPQRLQVGREHVVGAEQSVDAHRAGEVGGGQQHPQVVDREAVHRRAADEREARERCAAEREVHVQAVLCLDEVPLDGVGACADEEREVLRAVAGGCVREVDGLFEGAHVGVQVEEREGEADVIVAKHRNGPTKDIVLAWQGHYSRFGNMAKDGF